MKISILRYFETAINRSLRRARILALHQIRHDFGNDMMKKYIKHKRENPHFPRPSLLDIFQLRR